MSGCGIGESGSNESSQSTSGFSLLPQSIKDAYTGYAGDFNNIIGNVPTSLNGVQKAAIDAISAGTAPTASSIASDMALQDNPFNNQVISAIQRSFNGQGSQLTQAANAQGALGSNRYMLGANDINNTQAQTIGGFLNDQFNTQMGNALTTLPQARLNSALQTLNAQTFGATYPATALSAYGGALSYLPTSGGSQSNSSGSSQSMNAQI